MTTTQRRPAVESAPRATRRTGLMAGAVVTGLLIGLLGGWLIFGSDDVVTVDGSALTNRQTEMVELIDDAFSAWKANDETLVLSYYTNTATFVANDVEYPAADGSLGDYVSSFFGAPRMETVGPEVVVDGNTAISFHTYSGVTYANIFTFTSSGEVLIARHVVTG